MYKTIENEKVYIQYPGKETQDNPSKPLDFRPKVLLKNGEFALDLSFGTIWDILDEIGQRYRDSLSCIAAIFFRLGYMYNYRNAKSVSKSLKKMSTYIRKTIEKLMKEVSYESLTENIIAYCDGNFIKEYARLTKPQNNIHIYRGKIINMLEQMQADMTIYDLMIIGCVNEE